MKLSNPQTGWRLLRRASLPAALALAFTTAHAQSTATPTTAAPEPTASDRDLARSLQRPVPTNVPVTDERADDNTVTLSPFEVKAEKSGYFQANSMSGTRLNSKIEDLGQSITVMTKDQMSDFAMLDVNDVFDYMAGTEGTNSYSDFVVDRTGAVTDNVSLDPNNANRVRGIGKANVAFGNIAMTGRVPVDPLWMDSLELSRGPNANIFGLGEAGGTINQVPAMANLNRDFARTEIRADDYSGWRGSIDVNRVLFKNKLSVRASYANQHTGFVRKPSGEDARRVSLQLKAQPFKNTTLAVSYYGYKNVGTRPNYTTPRDNVTGWIKAGRPSWDPVTRLITVNGITYGQNTATGTALVAGSTIPITSALPSYFDNTPSDSRSILRVGTGNDAPYFTIPTITTATTPAANGTGNNIRFVRTAPVDLYTAAQQPLWNSAYAALSDKSIYDWDSINLSAANKAWDDTDTFYAQLDQVFISNGKHLLAAQASFMREDSERWEDLPLGAASVNGVIGELYVDPNTKNLDGTPNPYYNRPYIRSKEPFLRERPMLWDTFRAQAVYRVDFKQDKGWTKWFGTQQFLGYYEYKDQKNRNFAWRRSPAGRQNDWELAQVAANIPLANRSAPTGSPYGNSAGFMRNYEFYYVGDAGQNVQYAPSRIPETLNVPFVWGNTGSFHYDPTTLKWTPSPELEGLNTVIKTRGGVMQSFLLQDRLVTAFGLRNDKVADRRTALAVLTPDLLNFNWDESYKWRAEWRGKEGRTKTTSIVVRPLQEWGFVKRGMEKGGFVGFLAEAANGFSLTYNKSDNFIPQGPAVDLVLNDLPNQTGKSNEWGFWLNLFQNKVAIRFNHYDTKQLNKRDGDISTIAQRAMRIDGFVATDAWNLRQRSREWLMAVNGWTEANDKARLDAGVIETSGMTAAQFNGLVDAVAAGAYAATNDVNAKGDELEINVNPTRSWTVSASVTKSESINANAGSSIEQFLNQRIPIWTKIEDPRFTAANDPTGTIPVGATGHLLWYYIKGTAFTPYNYNATQSAAENLDVNTLGPLAVYRQTEGKPRPQFSKYTAKFNTRYALSGLTDNRILKNFSVGGSLRWNDQKAIGYYGVQSLPARVTQLDTNRPVYTKAETFVDMFVTYRTKLFNDRVRASFQLNVKNVFEDGGRLIATQVFPDGKPLAYRIVDPRQFILSASFDL